MDRATGGAHSRPGVATVLSPWRLTLRAATLAHSGGLVLMRRIHRYPAAAVGAVVIMLSAAACGGSDAEPNTEPSPTQSTTSASTSPSPTQDTDAWKANYSPAQLKAYDAALQRFESYESRAEPIWAKGKATPEAEALFKEFFPSPIWVGQWKKLQSYEQVEVKTSGTPSIYWSKAKSISDTAGSVEIVQCVDYTTVTSTQRGEPVKQYDWIATPQRRTITLQKPTGYGWLIYAVEDASTGKSNP